MILSLNFDNHIMEYYSPHLTHEDIEVQRSEVAWHSRTAGKGQSQDSNLVLPDAKIRGTLDTQNSPSLHYTPSSSLRGSVVLE